MKKTKKRPFRIIIVLCSIFTMLATLVYLVVPHSSIESVEDFSNYLDNNMDRILEGYNTPGAAIALIEDGQIQFINTYGYDNIIEKTPINEDSVFQMASISKPFTAWGIMNLVEEGKINLDEPIDSYLSRWKLPKSDYNHNEVTVRRLLSHTAGLSLSGYYGIDYDNEVQNIEESLSNPVDAEESVEVVIEPGTRFSYSGGGTTLLQLIIEEVTGKSFSAYMNKEVITRLGLVNTTFENIDISEYVSCYDKDLVEKEPVRFSALAAAGLNSTPEDMAKWILATTKNEQGEIINNVLNETTVRSMMIEEELKQSKNFIESIGGGFGLGYRIEPLFLKDRVFYTHIGHNLPGWKSIIAIDEEFNSGIVVMTNGANGYKVYSQVLDYYTDYVAGGTSLISLYNVRIPKVQVMVIGLLIMLVLIFLPINNAKYSSLK